MCVQYPQSGALETLRLASARPVSGGKSRGKVSALFRLPPFRREHAPGSFGLRLGLCAAKRSTTALPPAPTAPVPLSSRAAASLHPRTPRTRPGDRGESRGGSAAGAAPLRAPNSSCCSAPQDRTGSPIPVGQSQCPRTDSAAPATARPSGAAASPQRAAPCTAHRSRKTCRNTHPTPAPPLPVRRTIPQHSTRAYGA